MRIIRPECRSRSKQRNNIGSGNLTFALRVENPEREVCMSVIAPLVFLVTFGLVQPLTAQSRG
jgi:hypothetical protein